MSNRLLIEEALRRREVFNSLERYLKTIKEAVKSLSPDAEIYLFGSVAEGTHTYSSDVDILIVTDIEPAKILCRLWRRGIREPFQIHIQPPEKITLYKRRARLLPVNHLIQKETTPQNFESKQH